MSDPGSQTEGLRLDLDGPVATLWLDRPAKRNAVTYAMWLGITEMCGRLAADPDVRALVVRGTGDHFCAGADIGGLAEVDPADYRAANIAADDALASFPKPTVAVIGGSCVGGGTEIAVACDLRIADTTSRFGITPARLGIVYPADATRRVVESIGPSETKHLLYTADLIDAARALRIGLVNEVVAPEVLDERVDGLVTRIASERSLLTQMASKQIIASIRDDGVADPAIVERWDAEVAAAADPVEGVVAFIERRKPDFTWTHQPG